MLRRITSTFVTLLCIISVQAAEPASRGSISGVVTNQATGALLEDATIEIPLLNRTLLTDGLGRFFVNNVPFGEYEIIVSYTDLDTHKQSVMLTPETPTRSLDIPLSSNVYTLETFVVSGEREGTAAALTRQRTSDNVKNVLSMDAMGQLSNENPGELLAQIAGVAGVADESGDIVTVNIRGIDSSMSTVTYDGAQMATSFGTTSRSFRFLNINASTFEELEVIKALTPNIAASSLGGTVNMKTKSTLNMQGNLEFSYRASVRIAPSFFDYNPRRTDHPFGPLFSADYRQVFSVGDGYRNLGVYVNLFHTSRIDSMVKTQIDYTDTETTKAPDSYMYYYRATDNANTKYNDSATIRFDYKLSDRSRFYFTAMYSQQRDWVKPGMESIDTYYTGNQILINNGTSTHSEIQTGTLDVAQGPIGFFDAQYRAQFGGEHLLERVSIDYDFAYSRSDVDFDGNKNDYFAGWRMMSQITGMGAVIDKSGDSDFPYFKQTSGTYDMHNLGQYRNTRIQHRDGTRLGEVISGKLNAKTNISVFHTPVQIQSGVAYMRDRKNIRNSTQTYRFGGNNISSFGKDIELDSRFGENIVNIPRFDLGTLVKDYLDGDGSNWYAYKTHGDYYTDLYNYLQATQDLREDIYAIYLMGKTKIKNLSILAGVRIEETRARGSGWERKKYTRDYSYYSSSNEAGKDADWIQQYRKETAETRAYDEFGDRILVKRNYHDIFPSIHFTYSFTKNLLGRASFSTSIGRPEPREMIPGININTTERTVTRRNPDLIPQYANNYDLALEYYLPSAGIISAGVFRKDISDFMYTSSGEMITPDKYPDLTEWTGYYLTQKHNGKSATVDGVEFSYNQLLTFLPSPFKWTRFIVSYTLLSTKGDYGDNGTSLSTKDVQGFIPQTFSARINYSYKKFGMSISANWQDDYIKTYSPKPERSVYRKARVSVNSNMYWKFSKYLTLDIAVGNIFNEPFVDYRGTKDRRQITIYNGPIVTVGINGRF